MTDLGPMLAEAARQARVPPLDALAEQAAGRAARQERTRRRVQVTSVGAVVVSISLVVAGVTTHTGRPTPVHRPAVAAPLPAAPVPHPPRFGEVQRLPSIPLAARTGAAVVAAGDRVVVWGGEGEGLHEFTDGATLDVRTRTWSPVAPTRLTFRKDALALSDGTSVFVWGGVHSTQTDSRALADGALYQPDTRTWRALPPAPLGPRVPLGGVWSGAGYVVVGGLDSAGGSPRADGAMYSPVDDTWRRLPDLPEVLTRANVLWTGTDVVVVGSYVDFANRSRGLRVFAWRPGGTSWRRLPSPHLLPVEAGAAWDGRRLVAVDYVLHTAVLPLGAARWRPVRAPDLPLAESGPRLTSVAGGVVVQYGSREAVLRGDRWTALPRSDALLVAPVAGDLAVGLDTQARAAFLLRP